MEEPRIIRKDTYARSVIGNLLQTPGKKRSRTGLYVLFAESQCMSIKENQR
jgi:hypothetical protein